MCSNSAHRRLPSIVITESADAVSGAYSARGIHSYFKSRRAAGKKFLPRSEVAWPAGCPDWGQSQWACIPSLQASRGRRGEGKGKGTNTGWLKHETTGQPWRDASTTPVTSGRLTGISSEAVSQALGVVLVLGRATAGGCERDGSRWD